MKHLLQNIWRLFRGISFLPLFLFSFFDPSRSQEILVENAILAQVNESNISVMDVKRKMDLFIHDRDPKGSASSLEKLQFYDMSWRPTLMQMIDHALILSDASARNITIPDTEIREEIQHRFGPKVFTTLEELGISHDDAWKMVRDEMIVQRMSWWFVHSKANQKVTPEDVRAAYRTYIQKHPSFEQWSYQIITVEGANADLLAAELLPVLQKSKEGPDVAELKQIAPSIRISKLYSAKDIEMSTEHRNILSSLQEGDYSAPLFVASSKNKPSLARIFYLKMKEVHTAPSFQNMYADLRGQLVQQEATKLSEEYLSKLRQQYGFDLPSLQKSFPPEMHPFSIR